LTALFVSVCALGVLVVIAFLRSLMPSAAHVAVALLLAAAPLLIVVGIVLFSDCRADEELAGAVLIGLGGVAVAAGTGIAWGRSRWPHLGTGWLYIPIGCLMLGGALSVLAFAIGVAAGVGSCFSGWQ
jgi:hypothetical protein